MTDRRTGPSKGRNILFGMLDRLLPGENYNNQTGQWNATGGQWATGIGTKVLGAINPIAGLIGGAIGNGAYGQGPLAGMFGGSPPQPYNPQGAFDQNISNMTDTLAGNEQRIGNELSRALEASRQGGQSEQRAGSRTIWDRNAGGRAPMTADWATNLHAQFNKQTRPRTGTIRN